MSSRRRDVYLTGRVMGVDENRHFLLLANNYPYVFVKRKELYNTMNVVVYSASLEEKRDLTCRMYETGHPSPKDILELIHIYVRKILLLMSVFNDGNQRG